MPRIRTKPIHPYIQKWMDENGCATIKEAADKLGLSDQTLRRWADGNNLTHLEQIAEAADAFGKPVGEWLEGMLQKPA